MPLILHCWVYCSRWGESSATGYCTGAECYGSFQLEEVPVPTSRGVGIRLSPAYPGERTGGAVYPGEVHNFKAQCIVPHTVDAGQQHDIYFYELADGRG